MAIAIRSEPRYRAYGPVWPKGVIDVKTSRGLILRSSR